MIDGYYVHTIQIVKSTLNIHVVCVFMMSSLWVDVTPVIEPVISTTIGYVRSL